jgi:hypothetical protein
MTILNTTPAFPQQTGTTVTGMTLRAWLAGQALAAFGVDLPTETPVNELGIACVQAADAVIRELNK